MAGGGGMLDIDSMVGELAGLDVTLLGDGELAALSVKMEGLLNAVHAASAAVLGEFDRRGTYALDGAVTAASWVAGRTGSAKASLRARLRAAKALRVLPTAGKVAREGRLSPDHLTGLAACVRQSPEVAAEHEAALVDQALELDAEPFRAVTRHWVACAQDATSSEPEPAPMPVDELFLSQTLDGRYELRGSFSAESGALIAAALDGEVDRQLRAGRDGDPSVGLLASQVRASALVELACQTMRREPSDASVPDRYRVAVTIPYDQAGDLGVAGCDAPAYRAVLGADSDVLDVGRLTNRWPPGTRRAITLRDRSCTFPGCRQPPSRCDVHHCTPWQDGGRTNLDNGALACTRHHVFVHRNGWTITIEDGRPVTRRPDGTEHVIRRWDDTPPCQTSELHRCHYSPAR